MATLIRADQTNEVPDQLPVVALRDLVFFPYMVLPLLIGRPPSVAALEIAEEGDGYILLLAQKNVQVEDPERNDIHRVGTVARVLQVSRIPDGNARVVLEGLGRVRVRRFLPADAGLRASIEPFVEEEQAVEEALSKEVEIPLEVNEGAADEDKEEAGPSNDVMLAVARSGIIEEFKR